MTEEGRERKGGGEGERKGERGRGIMIKNNSWLWSLEVMFNRLSNEALEMVKTDWNVSLPFLVCICSCMSSSLKINSGYTGHFLFLVHCKPLPMLNKSWIPPSLTNETGYKRRVGV